MGETIALPPGELDRQEIVLQGDVIFSELARPRYDDVTCTDYATVIARQGILSRSVLLGGMVCVAGCSVRQPATAAPRPSAVVDLARDEVEVYGKALETLYAHTEERPGEIVVFDSLEYGLSVDCGGRTCLSPEVDSWVQKSTLAAYALALRSRGVLPDGVVGPAPIAHLSHEQLDSLLAEERAAKDPHQHDRVFEPFWDAFRRRFPRAWGLTVFSKIGFNPRRDQALLQVRHACGALCQRMESMFFQKRRGSWVFESRFPEAVQDWVGQGELRYPGPDARALAEHRKRQDSTRRAIADSVARDRAPRLIRGTVTSRKTGGPIPFAQIFVRSASTYTNPWKRVVADSAGRYEVRNPPLGGTMLEVQCPGPGHRLGATLDAPGTYVFPAMDTTINMTAPDISPCWKARRIRRLHVESVPSVNTSEVADDDERSAVYRSVLEALFPAAATRRQLIVISSLTRSRCVFHEKCGSPQLFRLEKTGQVDSSTVMDFFRVSRDSVLFGSRLPRNDWTTIMTPAEVSYLTREGQLKNGSDEPAGAFWNAFKEAYPTSPGLVSWTRVGFNSDHTQALVEVAVDTAAHRDDPPEMILLAKRRSGWRVVRRNIDREVTSGAIEGGVCGPVPKPAHRPDSTQVATLAGEFLISEIVTSRQTRLHHFRIRLTPPDSLGTRDSSAARHASGWPPSRFFPSVAIFDSTGEKETKLGARFVVDRTRTELVITDGALDGYYEALQIHHIEGGSFFGSWHSSFSYGYQVARDGSIMANPSGYFCAVRVAPGRRRR